MVWEIMDDAMIFLKNSSVKRVLTYEVWTPLQEYNVSENISDFIDLKKKLFSFYKSQLKKYKHDEAAVSLNRYRGITSGKGDYCEVFNCTYLRD